MDAFNNIVKTCDVRQKPSFVVSKQDIPFFSANDHSCSVFDPAMACEVVGHMLGLAAKNVESGVFRLKFVIFVFELFGELYVAVHALSRDTDGVSFIEFNH